MKKVLSTALITIGSLGMLAGIAGAVYGLAKHSDDLKQKIRGDDTAVRSDSSSGGTSQSTSDNSSIDTSVPEDPDQETYRGSYPASNPSSVALQSGYNNPGDDVGASIAFENHIFRETIEGGAITAPVQIKTAGWSRYNGATAKYEVYSRDGVKLPGVKLVANINGSTVNVNGQAGALANGGAEYTIQFPKLGRDQSYVFELRVTISKNGRSKTASQKITCYGVTTEHPYQGVLPEGQMSLYQADGTNKTVFIQEDSETANSADLYVVAPYEESAGNIKVTFSALFSTNGFPTLTVDGTSYTDRTVTVAAGTRIHVDFPLMAATKTNRYQVALCNLSTGEGVVYYTTLRNCGPSISDPIIGFSDNVVSASASDNNSRVVTWRNYLPADWEDGDPNTKLRIEWPKAYSRTFHASVTNPQGAKIDTRENPDYLEIGGVLSDAEYQLKFGYIPNGTSIPVTMRLVGPKSTSWSFVYGSPLYADDAKYFANGVNWRRILTHDEEEHEYELDYLLERPDSSTYAYGNGWRFELLGKSDESLPDPVMYVDGEELCEENSFRKVFLYSNPSAAGNHKLKLKVPALGPGQFVKYNIVYVRATNSSGSGVSDSEGFTGIAFHPLGENDTIQLHGIHGQTIEASVGENVTVPFQYEKGTKNGRAAYLYLGIAEDDTKTMSVVCTGGNNISFSSNGTNKWYSSPGYSDSYSDHQLPANSYVTVPAFAEEGTYTLNFRLTQNGDLFGDEEIKSYVKIHVTAPAEDD